MKSMKARRARSIVAAALLFTLVIGGSACKRQASKGESSTDKAKGEETSAAATGTGNTASKVKGPCGELQTKFCAEAGQESALCSSGGAALAMLHESACSAALKEFAYTQAKLKDERKACDDLVKKLCAGVGSETETCKMVTEKTQQFPTERCTAMLEQADTIIVDLKKQEMANQPLSADLQASIAASDAPSFGPADAKVTVVEFSDFECPYCSRAANVLTQLKQKYGDKIRVVFRQYPLSFHKNAQPAAEAALAAHAQGKFWEYHDKLFANQRQLDAASLEGYAKETGLDLSRFKTALDNDEFAKAVEADMKLGERVAVQGTPTIFVNGERVPNATDLNSVSQVIDKALGS